MNFVDRYDAGEQLAQELIRFKSDNPLVVALPRGGVPVGFQVASVLDAPLDVIAVRKLSVPYMPEWAMGAIGEGGVIVVDDEVIAAARVSDLHVRAVAEREREELERRLRLFNKHRLPLDVENRTVIIVDDGIATGATMKAACQVVKARHALRVIVAVPVASERATRALERVSDVVVSLSTPRDFTAVGAYYADFRQTTDAEVIRLLDRSAARSVATVSAPPQPAPAICDDEVDIDIGSGESVRARFLVPEDAIGCVIFAHGSGSSRHSPRNQHVARVLHEARIATLVVDLLTLSGEFSRSKVFDVELLATRLEHATKWVMEQKETRGLPVGYFGASTGAGAALWAAAQLGDQISAVVSRGGRPDLAVGQLEAVVAPTLLIVGGEDTEVMQLNECARKNLQCVSELDVIARATHLFEEPGALEAVAHDARDWFVKYFEK